MNEVNISLRCICCNHTPVKHYFVKKTIDRDFSILRCPNCQTAFVNPRPLDLMMDQYYQREAYSDLSFYQVNENDSKYYPNTVIDANRILAQCWRLKNGKKILDVGAGFGPFSHAAMKIGFSVSACEPNPNARAIFLRTNGFEPDASIFDDQYAKEHHEKFDVVLLSQVLEHIVNPNAMVKNIHRVLRQVGLAAIAVPHFGSALSKIQGKKDMYISPPEHLTYFTKMGLIKLFQRYDFKLEILETVTKVNKGRIEDRIPSAMLSQIIWRGLYLSLKIFERIDMGMVINAYFRKGS